MRRRTGLLVSLLAVGMLIGCPTRPKDGECRDSGDCAAQEGYGRTCVEGRCQECGKDTDCKGGFVCRTLKCLPRPKCERSDDCPAGQSCSSGRCVVQLPAAPSAECTTDDVCGAGKACRAGRCVDVRPTSCPVGGGSLMAIYFGYDKAVLTPEAQEALTKNAECIKAMGFKKVTIDGHCDARGSVEYNFRLGQRRADAARKYLMHLGIHPESIQTKSSGKSNPICTSQGEGCWQANRRDDIRAQ